MNEGTAGLVGVLIGALITGGITYLMQARRERREARAARRVVASEFDEADAALSFIKRQVQWPPGWIQHWSESWETYRPALALDLSDESFKRIARAYLNMRRLQTGLAAGKRSLIDSDPPFFEEVSQSLEEGRAALRGNEEDDLRSGNNIGGLRQ